MLSVQVLRETLSWMRYDLSKLDASAKLLDLSKLVVAEWQRQSQPIIEVRSDQQTADPTATVIFMHGLGDTGDGWASEFQSIAQQLPHVRFLFPTALKLPVTLNMGMRMPAWYDIASLDERRLDNEAPFIEHARAFVHSLLFTESQSLQTPQRMVVGGFSQGGALSLLSGHTYPYGLGGILSMSGYITARDLLERDFVDANRATPVLMCHGDADPVVPMRASLQSHEYLKQLKGATAKCDHKLYRGMQHASCQQEMQQVTAFLSNLLPKVSDTKGTKPSL